MTCTHPACECLQHPDKCFFKEENQVTAEKIKSTEFLRGKRVDARLKYNLDPNLDPIQNNCTYGWILPDRCRYNPRLGCDCGAYPAMVWDGKKYSSKEDPREFRKK